MTMMIAIIVMIIMQNIVRLKIDSLMADDEALSSTGSDADGAEASSDADELIAVYSNLNYLSVYCDLWQRKGAKSGWPKRYYFKRPFRWQFSLETSIEYLILIRNSLQWRLWLGGIN